MRLQISYGHVKAATDAWLLECLESCYVGQVGKQTLPDKMEIEDIALYSI